MLGTGRYQSLSELVAVAVTNQKLLDDNTTDDVQVLLGNRESPEASPLPASSDVGRDDRNEADSLAKTRLNGVSALFIHRPEQVRGPVAEVPDDDAVGSTLLRPNRWLFGQYNRLLPAKASCR